MQAQVDKVFTAYCKRQNFNGMSEEDKMYRDLGESVYKYFHEYVKDADKMSSNEIFRYLDKIIDQSGYRKIWFVDYRGYPRFSLKTGDIFLAPQGAQTYSDKIFDFIGYRCSALHLSTIRVTVV